MHTTIIKYASIIVGLLLLGAACAKSVTITPENTNVENVNVVTTPNSHTTGSFATTPSNQQ